ncbi:MAG: hypothetical protein ACRDOM_00795 [Nocardioides sp.]
MLGRLLPILVMLLPGLAGCSAGRDAAVADVAARFYAAVAHEDGRAACRLLAPQARSELESSTGARCEEAVLGEVTGSTSRPTVAVSGSSARATAGGDTSFLSEYGADWLVTATGCTPPPTADGFYECRVQGG